MKYFIKQVTYMLLYLMVLYAVNAQSNPLSAIKRICHAYNTEDAIRFSGELKMYAKGKPATIIEIMHSDYLIKGTNFTCSIGPVQMLLNNRYYVSVDNAIKLIIIGYRKDLSGTEQLPALNTAQFQKWIETKAMDAVIIKRGGASVLQITDTRGISGYSFYSIRFDARTGYMQKVILETSDYTDAEHKTMVLEINYSLPVKVDKSTGDFSEAAFFSVVDKKVQVTHSYRHYQLINQL